MSVPFVTSNIAHDKIPHDPFWDPTESDSDSDSESHLRFIPKRRGSINERTAAVLSTPDSKNLESKNKGIAQSSQITKSAAVSKVFTKSINSNNSSTNTSISVSSNPVWNSGVNVSSTSSTSSDDSDHEGAFLDVKKVLDLMISVTEKCFGEKPAIAHTSNEQLTIRMNKFIDDLIYSFETSPREEAKKKYDNFLHRTLLDNFIENYTPLKNPQSISNLEIARGVEFLDSIIIAEGTLDEESIEFDFVVKTNVYLLANRYTNQKFSKLVEIGLQIPKDIRITLFENSIERRSLMGIMAGFTERDFESVKKKFEDPENYLFKYRELDNMKLVRAYWSELEKTAAEAGKYKNQWMQLQRLWLDLESFYRKNGAV